MYIVLQKEWVSECFISHKCNIELLNWKVFVICVCSILYCNIVEKPNQGLQLRISVSYKLYASHQLQARNYVWIHCRCQIDKMKL